MTTIADLPARRHRSAADRSTVGAGAVAMIAVAFTAAELVTALLPGAKSFIAGVADQIIALTPAPVVRMAIERFGSANRFVLTVAIVTVALVAAVVAARAARPGRRSIAPIAVVGTLTIVSGWLAWRDPAIPPVTAVTAALTGGCGAMGVLRSWRRHLLQPAPRMGASRQPPDEDHAAIGAASNLPPIALPIGPTRRELLRWTGAAFGTAAIFGLAGTVVHRRTSPPGLPAGTPIGAGVPVPPVGTELGIDGLSPVITPNDSFYRIDTAFFPPRIDAETHAVRIHGMVAHPYSITYQELVDMADTEADVTLACVSNEVGGGLVGNARWFGVPLDRILDRAGVQPDADQIVGRAVDGWTAGFPVSTLDGRPALVAVGMNGEPLPVAHGYPVRLVVAGLYGYVSDTKWLAEIELTRFDAYDAYWITRGWSRLGPIKTQSRIDVPRAFATISGTRQVVAGVAWAGERGISLVEVRVDDGPWQRAELAEPIANTTWRQWKYDWRARAGERVIHVRATDGSGAVQTDERRGPAPDGATGHHTVKVTVT